MQTGNGNGTVDEPSNEPQGLQEPETEDIKTVPAGNTIYTSATSFEDLNLSPELLQVQISAWYFVSCTYIWLHNTRLELQANGKILV